MLSIVIPTLNEEKNLLRLFASISEQEFDDYEIIVADAGSEDRTREIAEEYGSRVVEGGLPAEGRNKGAEAARGEILLFVDADVILPEGFLKQAVEEFKKRELSGSSFFVYPANRNTFHKLLFNLFHNYPVKILSRICPHASMAIMAKREAHREIGGFDEEAVFLEDSEYVRRIAKTGKYRLQEKAFIFASVRRYKEKGWIKTYLKVLVADLYLTFVGPIKTDIFHYTFDHES